MAKVEADLWDRLIDAGLDDQLRAAVKLVDKLIEIRGERKRVKEAYVFDGDDCGLQVVVDFVDRTYEHYEDIAGLPVIEEDGDPYE